MSRKVELLFLSLQEENYEQDKRIKTLTFMVEKLKEELSTKEAVLMHGKRGKSH